MIDLGSPLAIHVVGVGGAGMSAIAGVLASMGHEVSGSDLKSSPNLDRLREVGVRTWVGHDPAAMGSPQFVAVSTAVPPTDPGVEAARALGIPVLRRAEILAGIAATRRTLAVAGTHGKTTTSSMLALMLVEASLSPGFIIGGDVNEIGTGSAWGSGELFVVEADESDGTFLTIPRVGAVVTSIEPDHLEHYGGYEGLRAAFAQFMDETDGPVVVCIDDTDGASLAQERAVITYGTSPAAAYRIVDATSSRSLSSCRIVVDGETVLSLTMPIPGLHNLRNATGAAVLALHMGVSAEAIVTAMARFGGVARRFQFRGDVNGATLIDDYAHLPTEVRAALAAARSGGYHRVIAVFQPHRYSRTQALAHTFADAFIDADVLVVTDIYPSGEEPRPGVTGRLIVDAVAAAHPADDVRWAATLPDVVELICAEAQPGDVVITLGAGDLTLVPDEVLRVTASL